MAVRIATRLLLSAVIILLTQQAHGQVKIFHLNKLDSANFRNFIASKKVIVIGEMHGTTEVPLFVLQLVRQLKKDQKRLIVGLEIPINHQKDLDSYMKTGDFEKLSKLEYFKYPDGRTSVAMGELIKGLRTIRKIKVVCFDTPANTPIQANRDSLMGVNLASIYKSGQMVMLTGNLHANLKEGYWKPEFKSACFYFNKIERFNNELISLNTMFGSGTIWNCMTDGCREREAFGNPNYALKKGPPNYMAVYEGPQSNGYSGYVYIDKVTASKPLVN